MSKVMALPLCASSRPRSNHQRPENHRCAHAKPLGGLPHCDAADECAEPSERVGQRRHRALAAEIGRDRFEADDGYRQCGKKDGGDAERC